MAAENNPVYIFDVTCKSMGGRVKIHEYKHSINIFYESYQTLYHLLVLFLGQFKVGNSGPEPLEKLDSARWVWTVLVG